MGIGCPNSLSSKPTELSLPVLNMIVLGFPKSGKSALIARLGLIKE
jgi:ribosome biogenesis GTPase A